MNDEQTVIVPREAVPPRLDGSQRISWIMFVVEEPGRVLIYSSRDCTQIELEAFYDDDWRHGLRSGTNEIRGQIGSLVITMGDTFAEAMRVTADYWAATDPRNELNP